ncbi:hypothetical protein [Aeoliella mucimassa]|nr:hypothetical protein [Aeoliella mucimassa]
MVSTHACAESQSPRIVNIVNFIRLLEPRSEAITEQVLFQTVVKQVELMKQHQLPGTFLLQYDALKDERYQKLLKGLPREQFEIGCWWELPQPLVEKAGLRWRGRYPWDWHSNVGFASGYTPEERERLVDVYMADFHDIYGYYPKSAASWFIDAHTLKYMHDKYGVIASANCKDQVGTDGYTLWGGYWNQAYYPSTRNAYMPSQTTAGQIPVPIFRMLGSDPLRQYDTGVGHTHQGVISLEPVYGDSGGDPQWVDWYLQNFVDGECLAFNYVQAGQENSFTWPAMQRGLEYQFPKIAKLRDEHQVRVETLAESGEWFRREFPVTPSTSVTFQTPLKDDDRQTIWFNSRFYRANLAWQSGRLWFRDLHLFDQSLESPILTQKVDRPEVEFYTLPIVDGFHWSSRDVLPGLRFVTSDGEIVGGEPKVTHTPEGFLQVTWPLQAQPGAFVLTFSDQQLRIELTDATLDWHLELTVADQTHLPFKQASEHVVSAVYHDHAYQLQTLEGEPSFSDGQLRLTPNSQTITLQFTPSE